MRSWIDLALALVVGFMLGREWMAFACRYALRHDSDIVSKIQRKYGK